jgi:hypothetical protein
VYAQDKQYDGNNEKKPVSVQGPQLALKGTERTNHKYFCLRLCCVNETTPSPGRRPLVGYVLLYRFFAAG